MKKNHPAQIKPDDLNRPDVRKLIEAHLQDLAEQSPAESMHALDVQALRDPSVTVYSSWINNELAGIAATKQLNIRDAEIKSMRTRDRYLYQGVASQLLLHLIHLAKTRHYKTLYLETGSLQSFKPARALYRKHGFIECEPFADYSADPLSIYMQRSL